MEHLFLSIHEGCPHVTRGPVPTSSNCLTCAFTLPFLSEVSFEFLCWDSGEKGKSSVTSQPWGLEGPRLNICCTWSQTSSAPGPAWVAMGGCGSAGQGLALGTASRCGRSAPAGWDGAGAEAGRGDAWCPQPGRLARPDPSAPSLGTAISSHI